MHFDEHIPSKESHKMSKGLTVTELIMNRNRPEEHKPWKMKNEKDSDFNRTDLGHFYGHILPW
jgi:hypothetical protein